MYVRTTGRGLEGFWGTMVKGSLFVGKHGISIAAAGATGGASAVALEAGSQLAQGVAGKKGKVQPTDATSAVGGGNFLNRMSSTELVLLGVGGLAVVAGLARR